MKEKINKTNVARLLDKAKVAYKLVPYEVDENDLSATHVAEQLGEDVSQVFKTLVLRGDKSGYFVCVIPGAAEVNLKKAAKVSGNKSCEMIHVKELLPLTGYIRGGCSPIGMKKHFPPSTGLGYNGRKISIKESKSVNPNNKSHRPLRFDLFSFSAIKTN